MSAITPQELRQWDRLWEHEHGWDEFTELVSLVVDDVMPTPVPLDGDWLRHLAAEVVVFMLHDPDARPLLGTLWSASYDCICPDDGTLSESCPHHGFLVRSQQEAMRNA